MSRRIELIDPDAMLASPELALVRDFLRLTRRTQIGWHYLTDLVWILRQARQWPAGSRVLDAGGGKGPLQYLLLELGFDVCNVDLTLPALRPPLMHRYRASRRTLGSFRPTPYRDHLENRQLPGVHLLAKQAMDSGPVRWLRDAGYGPAHALWRRRNGVAPGTPPGRLEWVVGNLCAMPELADGMFDAVVSLSALEHVPRELLPGAIAEIGRVLRPDAAWAVTTSATDRERTWFHEPSKGWCFTPPDLAALFAATPPAADAGEILERYRRCEVLRDGLAGFYFRSGDNGMPWGAWEPAYVPAGIGT